MKKKSKYYEGLKEAKSNVRGSILISEIEKRKNDFLIPKSVLGGEVRLWIGIRIRNFTAQKLCEIDQSLDKF